MTVAIAFLYVIIIPIVIAMKNATMVDVGLRVPYAINVRKGKYVLKECASQVVILTEIAGKT